MSCQPPNSSTFTCSQCSFRCLEGNAHVRSNFPQLLTSPVPQNTEDEVLKAAIAKYGKNQW